MMRAIFELAGFICVVAVIAIMGILVGASLFPPPSKTVTLIHCPAGGVRVLIDNKDVDSTARVFADRNGVTHATNSMTPINPDDPGPCR